MKIVTYSPLTYLPRKVYLYLMSGTYSNEDQNFLKSVGTQIREARQKLELSQEKFAHVCKLDRTYISDVERGERNISLLNLSKIANALDVPITQLISIGVQ